MMPMSASQRDRAPEDLAGEERRDPVVCGIFVDARNLRAAGDAAGHAERQAAQHEQAAERDDEGRQAGVHDDQAVEPADQHRDGEGEQHAKPRAASPR